jgi:hypothetical protein
MRAHDHELDEPGAERVAAPRKGEDEGVTLRALAAGRTDALGAGGILRLQRIAGNSGVGSLLHDGDEEASPVRDVVGSGGGQPLDSAVRSDMETRFGADFGDVRVHTDAAATESAKSVQAGAYTVGNHVVFQRDHYPPETDAGRHTLAHELTHVLQQRSGPVDGTPAPGGISVSHPSDRFEQQATATADRVLATPVAPAVQRQDAEAPAEEEEEPVQGSFLQRQEVSEEEEPESEQ